jgi:hypothetical protein
VEPLLKYAVFDGHNWQIEGVHDPLASLSGSISLAFNPKQRLGYPTVAYLGVLRGHSGLYGSDLMYAERHRVGWNVKNIAGYVRSPCLAFTPAGEPAISYSTGTEVLYSVFGNGWTRYLVVRSRRDPQTQEPIENFEWTALAFNSATGAPVISYYDQTTRTISCAIGTVRNVVLG